MDKITWNDFEKVELRIGTIIEAMDLPNAKNPAFVLRVDFGEEIGIKKSSTQITQLYKKESLIGKQVIAVVNFPSKQIGSIMSECLVTGFYNKDGNIVLAVPDKDVPNGSKLL